MSRDFSNIATLPYKEIINSVAVKIQGISGQGVPLFIPWSTYGAPVIVNIGVSVSLEDASVRTPLGQIRSIYIDNMNSPNPIYVQFPDTGYTVVCKPNATVWLPVYTNQFSCFIFGLGFTVANTPSSKILITNIDREASVDIELDQNQPLWLASSQITRGSTIYNQNVGVPALGDQFSQPILDLAVNGTASNLFGTPYTSGFIYITDMDVYIGALSAAGGQNRLFFESTGIAGVFTSMDFGFATTAFTTLGTTLVRTKGNWKIDATQTWRLRNQINFGAMQGVCRFSFSYTYNPQ